MLSWLRGQPNLRTSKQAIRLGVFSHVAAPSSRWCHVQSCQQTTAGFSFPLRSPLRFLFFCPTLFCFDVHGKNQPQNFAEDPGPTAIVLVKPASISGVSASRWTKFPFKLGKGKSNLETKKSQIQHASYTQVAASRKISGFDLVRNSRFKTCTQQ